jgi:hypothetical protein
MNGKSDETLSKKRRTNEQPRQTNFRLVSRESTARADAAGRGRSETPETASQHASRRHWDDNDDDSGPTAA